MDGCAHSLNKARVDAERVLDVASDDFGEDRMNHENGRFWASASPLSHALIKVIPTLISCLALKELVRLRIVFKLGEKNHKRSINKAATSANTLSRGIIGFKVNASALWARFHSVASTTYCVVEKPCQVVIFDTREGQLVNWQRVF